jgi:hypothetical protein
LRLHGLNLLVLAKGKNLIIRSTDILVKARTCVRTCGTDVSKL